MTDASGEVTIKRLLEVNDRDIARKSLKRSENTESTRKVKAREDEDILQAQAARAVLVAPVVLLVLTVVLPVAQVPAQVATAMTRSEKFQNLRQSVQRQKKNFFTICYILI